MTTMNISLPKELKVFIDKQVKSKRYGTSSEYVRYLIREREIYEAENDLREKLIQGMNSGYEKYETGYFRKTFGNK